MAFKVFKMLTSQLKRAWVCLLMFSASVAFAHRASDAFLDVQSPIRPGVSQSQFQLSIALRDWDAALPLDSNADGQVTWAEVDAAAPELLKWVSTGVRLGGCPLTWRFSGLERRGGASHAVLQASPTCTGAGPWVLNYDLFKTVDSTHRLIVTGQQGGKDLLAATSPGQAGGLVLRNDSAEPRAPLDEPQSRWQTAVSYFFVGAHHLLEGFDHMAFLLALVLPLRLSMRSLRRRSAVAPVTEPAPNAVRTGQWLVLLLTVTAFTVGHSITLALAVFGVIGAPPVWVEPMIAVSIAVSALLNIFPIKWVRGVHLAFAFGLIHGLAFAGLLIDAAAPVALLPWALAGFNLGVEAGQLLAVGVWVIVSQAFIHRPEYRRLGLPTLSWLLVGISVFWFAQRLEWY